jgi:hypothetical protein
LSNCQKKANLTKNLHRRIYEFYFYSELHVYWLGEFFRYFTYPANRVGMPLFPVAAYKDNPNNSV